VRCNHEAVADSGLNGGELLHLLAAGRVPTDLTPGWHTGAIAAGARRAAIAINAVAFPPSERSS
jgi:hypothetical protein